MMDMKATLLKMRKGEPLTDDELIAVRNHLQDLITMLHLHGEYTALLRTALHAEMYSLELFIHARGLE